MKSIKRIAAFSVSALLSTAVSSAYADIAHEWKLDEVSGSSAADSIGAFVGPILGTSTWTAGKIGNSFSVTGSNVGYVNPGNVPISGSFTLSFWVKPEDISLDWRNMISKHDGAAGTKSFWVGQSGTDGVL